MMTSARGWRSSQWRFPWQIAAQMVRRRSRKSACRKSRSIAADIAGDVQSLSHQLHSSKLDYLGVVAAIKGFCDEFSRQHEVNIKITDEQVPRELPQDISLCLFRVAQEALQNAVKYSGTNEFTVLLLGMGDCVQLVVSDAGAGFDVEAAKMNRGLGLVSMQERVHLVHGTLSVESQPGKGTKILAVVPLADEGAGQFKVVSKDDRLPATTR